MLQDPTGSVCGATLNILEMLGKGGIGEETFDMLRGEREVMHETAVKMLVAQEQIPLSNLMSIFEFDDWQMRQKAIGVLKEQEGLISIEMLIKLLRDDVRSVRWAIMQALRVRREWMPTEDLVKLLEDNDWRVRRGLVEALRVLGEPVPNLPPLSGGLLAGVS